MKSKTLECYKGLKINSSKTLELSVYPVIIDRIYDQLSSLQSHHSRITIVRIDLHFPNTHQLNHKLENKLMSQYIKSIKVDLGSKKWGSHKRFIHGWVKEIGVTLKSHYHLFIGFQTLQRSLGAISKDGHSGLWGLLERRWKELTDGSVHFSKHHVIDRKNAGAFSTCFYHLSYLAKTRDKQFNTGENYRRFSFSSLRANHTPQKLKITAIAPTVTQGAY